MADSTASVRFRPSCRRGRGVLLAAALLAGCDIPGAYWDGQRKMEEIAGFLGTQQGDAVAAGSPLFGKAGTLGSTGRTSFSLRAVRAGRNTPSVSGTTVSTTGTKSATFSTSDGAVTAVTADAGVSLWRGFGAGRTHAAGITLLGGMSLHPGFGESDIEIDGGDGLAVALGIRLGILEETGSIPGIAITTTWRGLPGFSLRAPPLPTDDGGTMVMKLDEVNGHLIQSRIAVSKEFGKLGLILGYGADSYTASGYLDLRITDSPHQGSEFEGQTIMYDRTALFAGATWRLAGVTFGAEVGRLGALRSGFPWNRFGGRSDWSRTYLSLGTRIEP